MLKLIHTLLTKDIYNKYIHLIKINKEQKETAILFRELKHLHETYTRDLSLDEYKFHVLSKYPELETFIEQVSSAGIIGEDILSDTFKHLQQQQLCYDLALVAVDAAEGRKSLDTVLEFVDKIQTVKPPDEEVQFITDDLEELYNETVHTPGLRWRLDILNKSLGSLRRGDFGFIFARPETGKTTFLASEVTYFAEQTEQPILWFNNEEQGNKVKIRLFQASLGITLPQLYSDRKGCYNKYIEKTKGTIKLLDSASIHRRQVERIVHDMKPAAIIFDQIDKIKGFDADREDLRLGSIYIWGRELAKEYCPVIGVCQADVSGEGKKWLTMDNVANAKTSKQAEADWILGIGMIHDPGYEYVRYLHLSKNKLAGDEDSDQTLRHGRLDVVIKPEIARYIG